MKRHLDYYTKSDQPLKDRSRFWTWYMRGLHGDMDTRFEGDRRLLGLAPPRSRGTVLVPEKIPASVSKPRSLGDGLLFRPLQSDTYGYHPKGASFGRKSLPPYPTPGIEPISSGLPPLERPWKDWGTALKPLDDLVLNPKPLVSRAPIPRRRWIPPRLHHYDPELDDLLNTEDVAIPRISYEALEAAEKALTTLKCFAGTTKSYDTAVEQSLENLQDYLDAWKPERKRVTFKPDVF